MKEVLAAVAILVCGIMAYRVYQVKFAKPVQQGPEKKIILRPLSSVLETLRTPLAEKLEKDSSVEVATPLRQLKNTVMQGTRPAGPHGEALYSARIAALDQLLAVAEERRKAIEEITRIRHREPSALERVDSSNTAKDFFISTVLRRIEANRPSHEAAIESAFATLRAAEQSAEQNLGPGASLSEYPVYRLFGHTVTVQREDRVNPLNREAYDWRRSSRQREELLLDSEGMRGMR